MSTVRIKRRLAVLQTARSAAVATTNGTGTDASDQGSLLFELYIDVSLTTATIDLKIQESPDNSTWTDIPGAAITQIVDSGGDAAGKYAYIDVLSSHLTVDSAGSPMRYMRFVLVNAVANVTAIVTTYRYWGRYNDARDVDIAAVVESVEV